MITLGNTVGSEIDNLEEDPGYLMNCDFYVGNKSCQDRPAFYQRKDGTIVAHLDGYIIASKDEYVVVKK
jgi:hypothetical protein